MPDREFRLLTVEEVITLYSLHMKRDFPKDELKPLKMILTTMEQGLYAPYGLFEDGGLVAYALYWRAEGEHYVMLDYFAVVPQKRNQGVGGELLKEMLERFCQDGNGVFGEVETPDSGKEEVDALRRRRLGFYARAGMRTMGFRTKIFGVTYAIIAYGPEISDEALIEVDRKIYRSAFPDSRYDSQLLIPYESDGEVGK